MPRALLFVFSNPTSGDAAEDAYNEWYDSVHARQIRDLVSGVIGVSRYSVTDVTATIAVDDGSAGEPTVGFPHRYAAIYELDADDPEAVVREIRKRAATGQFDMSPSIDLSIRPPTLMLFVPRDKLASVRHPTISPS